MFSKVLVANRGEIAVRINQTLRALGIAPVAVYSEPDAGAPHVMTAEQSVPLSGATAEETYLSIPKIIRAARDTGADAIHPGYGFLSENPEFARACRTAGIAFTGQSRRAWRSWETSCARRILPLPLACKWCPVGVPLMVKATAGGGGRGMRLVNGRRELAGEMESASREAQAAFGDGRVFPERYIANPRHVGVQVLADGSGHIIHLGEREGGVQRHHQTIIEETSSPALTPELRGRMDEVAVAVARGAGYVNAGTVEFLVEPRNGEFYFLNRSQGETHISIG